MADGDFTIRTVAIVGARGQMGRLFMDRGREAGYQTLALDRPLEEQDLASILARTDLLILSVPVTAIETVLKTLTPHVRENTILADLTSVKVAPMLSMRKLFQGPLVGTHPLFGPKPGAFTRVAMTPGDTERDQAATLAVETYIRDLGFVPFRTTPEEHDFAVGLVQGLNFVTSVAYLATLSHVDNIRNFLTPSFQRRLEAARKMLLEDSDLFSTLFEANPYGQDAVKRFRNFLNVAAGGDIDLLVQRAQWWWGTAVPDGCCRTGGCGSAEEISSHKATPQEIEDDPY